MHPEAQPSLQQPHENLAPQRHSREMVDVPDSADAVVEVFLHRLHGELECERRAPNTVFYLYVASEHHGLACLSGPFNFEA